MMVYTAHPSADISADEHIISRQTIALMCKKTVKNTVYMSQEQLYLF